MTFPEKLSMVQLEEENTGHSEGLLRSIRFITPWGKKKA